MTDEVAIRAIGEITRPVDLIRMLATGGRSLKEAREILDRLAVGEEVILSVPRRE